MGEIKIQDKVNNFLNGKNINNPFVRECVLELVEGHTKEFGSIVSEDEFISRLECNLDKITFAGRKGTSLGEYKGRIDDNTEQNEILIYADESELELSEFDQKSWDIYTPADKQKLLQSRDARREEIKNTIKHELVHAAYTIKGEYGIGENHIFSKNGRNLFGLNYYSFVGGNSNFVEAIVNYIATRSQGKSLERLETYEYETKAIDMLAEKMGEDIIIKSAWESDEPAFQKAYEEKCGESYPSLNRIMGKLISLRRESDLRRYITQSKNELDSIQQLLDGRQIDIETAGFKEQNTKTNLTKLDDMKDGLEDVSQAGIRKSWLDKVINFVKGLSKDRQETKEKQDGEER